MAIIRSSGKMTGGEGEYLVCAGKTVFFRLVENGDRLDFNTATADEDASDLKAYHDRAALIRHTAAVLADKGLQVAHDRDLQGRGFVETVAAGDADEVLHLAALILDRLGIRDDISVLALREMRSLHADLCAEDDRDVYLSDKTALTPDGRLVKG